ncbi:MAG: cupredoxin domain-containing protein [Armatimonadetes bacterium]|nr:cupredoxin domain-containing protein [Armatimonadota bacterium]
MEEERRSNGIVYLVLVVAIVALIISVVAYAGRPKPQPATARPPATLTLPMVVATFTGQGMAAHRWYPTMLVARKGDTIDLEVANPDEVSHRFELTGYDLKTKVLTPGSSDSFHFVADQNGVFTYRCVLPYDPAKRHCTPDHELMRGYLIVTE